MTKKKKILLGSIAAVVPVLCALLLSYFVFQVPLFDVSGWRTTDTGSVQYLDYYGRPCTDWVTVEDNRYYFDSTGTMQTGWLTTADGLYYLGQDGAAHVGWLDGEEGRYYFDDEGAARIGWLETDAGNYYFNSKGLMFTGWLKSEGEYYYFAEDGTMQTGWLTTEDGRYYLHEDGTMHVSWLDAEDGRYFFNVDGTMRTGWLTSKDGTFYLTDSGKAHTGWLTTEQARYYMQENGAAATGFVTVDGKERFFLQNGHYVPLVNPWNPITDDYVLQLVEVENYQVDATCAEALKEFMAACRAAGLKCKITSAYRDLEKQQSVWEDYRRNYMNAGYSYEQAEKMTARYVAVPGTSEHHLGVAVDLGSGSKTYAWLAEHCWEYGFILRYPADKASETGFAYEPWHFRYLGKPLAKAVHESGLTLEEYFDSIK